MQLVGTFEVKWQYCRETADRIEEFIYEKEFKSHIEASETLQQFITYIEYSFDLGSNKEM